MFFSRTNIGDLITFTYTSETATDKNPTVLILHNNWQGLLHGLNFSYLTTQEQSYVKSVLNSEYAEEIKKKDARIKAHLERLGSRIDDYDIKNPHDFYIRFIRGFIMPRAWEPYRKYKPANIVNSRTIVKADVMTGKVKGELFNQFANKFKHRFG